MTYAEYKKMSEAEMKRRRWRTTTATETVGGLKIAAGVEVSVERKHGGFSVRSPECSHCGVSFRCRNVHPSQLEEIIR